MCIANLKFPLLCFEALFGLKINFLKSQVIVTGASDVEASRVANLLNCNSGPFPSSILAFLSFPSSCVLGILLCLFSRWVTGNALDGRYNSSAGRVCLINACLSSLPMFLMGFYKLLEGTHAGFDKHRSYFYWNSADNKKKYMLVKWKIMCRPKNLGGLGIINTSTMNNALSSNGGGGSFLQILMFCGWTFLKLSTLPIIALYLPLLWVVPSFGAN